MFVLLESDGIRYQPTNPNYDAATWVAILCGISVFIAMFAALYFSRVRYHRTGKQVSRADVVTLVMIGLIGLRDLRGLITVIERGETLSTWDALAIRAALSVACIWFALLVASDEEILQVRATDAPNITVLPQQEGEPT